MRVPLSTFGSRGDVQPLLGRAALRTALSPETRTRATEVAGMIRTDGAAVAAQLLVDLVGSI